MSHPSVSLPASQSITLFFVSGCLLQASVSGGLQSVRLANMDSNSGETNRSSQHKAALILRPPHPHPHPPSRAWLQKAGWRALGQTDELEDGCFNWNIDRWTGRFAILYFNKGPFSVFECLVWLPDLTDLILFLAKNFKQHFDKLSHVKLDCKKPLLYTYFCLESFRNTL